MCSQGYRTALFGKWHLGRTPFLPAAYGFELFKPGYEGAGPGPSYLSPWQWEEECNFHSHSSKQHIEDRMAAEAVDWIRWQVEEARPFFLSYWAFSVHGPFESKAALVEKYTQKAQATGYPYAPVYAAMVEVLDDAVGALTGVLSALQVEHNTITIFSSDNGADAVSEVDGRAVSSNKPLRGGKATIYEGGVRVPLSFTWPGKIAKRAVSRGLFAMVDFFPTILDLVEADLTLLPQALWKSKPLPGTGRRASPAWYEPPTALSELRLDGVSHKALLLGLTSSSPRDVLFQYYPVYNLRGSGPCASVRRGEMKFVRHFAQGSGGSDLTALFNLTHDLGEQVDLLQFTQQQVQPPGTGGMLSVRDAHHIEVAAELNLLLDEWFVDRGTIVPQPSVRYWQDHASTLANQSSES